MAVETIKWKHAITVQIKNSCCGHEEPWFHWDAIGWIPFSECTTNHCIAEFKMAKWYWVQWGVVLSKCQGSVWVGWSEISNDSKSSSKGLLTWCPQNNPLCLFCTLKQWFIIFTGNEFSVLIIKLKYAPNTFVKFHQLEEEPEPKATGEDQVAESNNNCGKLSTGR